MQNLHDYLCMKVVLKTVLGKMWITTFICMSREREKVKIENVQWLKIWGINTSVVQISSWEARFRLALLPLSSDSWPSYISSGAPHSQYSIVNLSDFLREAITTLDCL